MDDANPSPSPPLFIPSPAGPCAALSLTLTRPHPPLRPSTPSHSLADGTNRTIETDAQDRYRNRPSLCAEAERKERTHTSSPGSPFKHLRPRYAFRTKRTRSNGSPISAAGILSLGRADTRRTEDGAGRRYSDLHSHLEDADDTSSSELDAAGGEKGRRKNEEGPSMHRTASTALSSSNAKILLSPLSMHPRLHVHASRRTDERTAPALESGTRYHESGRVLPSFRYPHP